MSKLRKTFVVSVMFMTVLAMSVVVVPPVKAAAQAGDLIKMEGLSSVYYLGADGKRYVFPNETTYFSWYSDFSSVKTIPQSELESYPLGANVTIRPGTYLVKIQTDPKVYAVEPGGNLVWIPDEATAKALYGDNWASRVVDVPDAFFTNYTVTDKQVSSDAYPAGSLIKLPDSADVYYIDENGKARKIADEAAFNANRFNWDFVITTAEDFTLPELGAEITGAESDLTDTSEGAGGTAEAGTGLTVALASDTPAAGNIPAGSPTDFLHLAFTASADGDVNITGLKLTAYDLGTATYIDDATVYVDGVKKGSSKDFNSDREATFNFATPITVPAGETVTLVIKATIDSSASGGNYALGVAAASDVTTNGAVVSGTFPIIGNTKAIVSGTNIGSITLSNVDGTDVSDVQFGEDDVLLASFNLTADNVEPIIWESASFRNGGTNNDGLVSNLRLLIDGDEVATADGIVDKYVNFNVGNYVIAKNDTVNVEIYGDIGIGNVGNTIALYIKDANDLSFVGQSYGYGILLSDADLLDSTSDAKIITLTTGDLTLDMDKTATPAKDVKVGAQDVVLATIKMTSNGEDATVNQIVDDEDNNYDFYITGNGLECNEIDTDTVILKDVDNNVSYDVTVASSTTSMRCGLSITEEISLPKGVTKTFQLIVDLQDTNDTNSIDNNDTLKVVLAGNAMNVTGDESDASITNITPSSVTSAITTVKGASLTWTTKSMTNKTLVPGAENVPIYTAGLSVGSASDVELTKVRLDVDDSKYDAFNDNNISQLTLYIRSTSEDACSGKVLATKSNYIQEDDTDDAYVQFSNLNSTNRMLTAGEDYYLDLCADFSSSFSSTGTFALEITGKSAVTARDDDNDTFDITVANADTDSRLVTLVDSGTLKVELKTDEDNADNDIYLLAGSENDQDHYLAELVFTTAYERVKVKDLALGRASGANFTDSDILAVRLYDKNGNMIAEESPSADGNVYFDDIDLILPADQATSYFIGVVAKSINADGDPQSTATYGRNVAFIIASSTQMTALGHSGEAAVTAEGVDSGDTITLTQDPGDGTISAGEYASATTTSKTATIVGSVLTSVTNAMDDTTLSGGNSKTIAKYKFVFDNGSNRNTDNEELKARMKQLILTLATSSNVQVSNVQAYIEGNSSNKTTVAQPNVNNKVTIDLTSLSGDTEYVDGEVTLVIVGDITTSDTSQYLQTEIDDLTTDFYYDGDNDTSTDNTQADRLDYSDVSGATLSN